jgi:aminoglycoside phosphotransferase family enzyme/predicted kinase
VDLAHFIAELSLTSVFPRPVTQVEVRQTHISIVLLADEVVYKIRKPVKLPFVDFSTLELRKRDCDAEIRLNSRLAPDVYLGVVPIVRQADGLRIEGNGLPIEWAVKMRRLSDHDTLASRLERDQITAAQIDTLGRQLAAFHAAAERSPRIAEFGRTEVVAANARGNFAQTHGQIDVTISRSVFERIERKTEECLARLEPLLERRAARGVPCDAHGDLRADHVYFLDDEHGREPRTVVIDCLEFNDAFRYSDPVADMAFLAMDLQFARREDLAAAFVTSYFAASGDDEGRELLPFYVAYRAAVRAKVEGLKAAETEVPQADRTEARTRATGYWLLALAALEPPERRPALVLLGGLPGSGKSTLAAQLVAQENFHLVRSDVVRKELAGKAGTESSPNIFGTGLYAAEWNDRTYAECLARTESLLRAGGRVLVDASFREDQRRRQFLQLADRLHVSARFLVCEAPAGVIRRRLEQRQGDASDADWEIYKQAASNWQPTAADLRARQHVVQSGGTREESLSHALKVLREAGLASV